MHASVTADVMFREVVVKKFLNGKRFSTNSRDFKNHGVRKRMDISEYFQGIRARIDLGCHAYKKRKVHGVSGVPKAFLRHAGDETRKTKSREKMVKGENVYPENLCYKVFP